jgi:hypothetical protein
MRPPIARGVARKGGLTISLRRRRATTSGSTRSSRRRRRRTAARPPSRRCSSGPPTGREPSRPGVPSLHRAGAPFASTHRVVLTRRVRRTQAGAAHVPLPAALQGVRRRAHQARARRGGTPSESRTRPALSWPCAPSLLYQEVDTFGSRCRRSTGRSSCCATTGGTRRARSGAAAAGRTSAPSCSSRCSRDGRHPLPHTGMASS